MRLSTVTKTALSASAAVVLLTACGGGSDEETAAAPSSSSSAATTTSSSSSAAETSPAGDPEAAAFCSEVAPALAELQGLATLSDPTALPTQLADASAQLSEVQPPAEISDAWTSLTGALSQVATNVQGLDLSTPEGQQALLTEVTSLQTNAGDAPAEIQAYVVANCDIGAAPTS